MIKYIYIIILLLTIISCNKKSDDNSSLTKYIKINRVINTGSQYNGMSTEFAFTICNDQVLLNPQLTEEGFSIKVFDTKKNNFTRNYFKVNRYLIDTLKHYFGSQPWDIDADSVNIYALFGDRLLVIDRNNDNRTYLTNLKEPYQKLKVFNKELILWRAYNFHPLITKIPIQIVKYDIKSKRIISNLKILSDAIEFSHFTPMNWIDISNKKETVFSQTLKPEHYLYDSNFRLEQKLFHVPKNWKNINMNELNLLRKSKKRIPPTEIIQRLNKTDNGPGCRVISVNFANDTTLLVFYSSSTSKGKNNFVRFCNIWKNRKGNWILSDKELKDANPDLTTISCKENYPFNGSYHNIKFYKNKAYYIDVTPNEDKLLQFGQPYSVVKKEINKYFAKEKLYYQLFIYSTRF